MTDEKKTYRVTDRRQFTAEGESVATESGDDPSEAAGAAPGVDSNPVPREGFDSARGAVPPESQADFVTFIVSLATQASVLLAGTEGVPPDLNGAKWLISILEMLRDKTEGRRTPDETDALEGILYELRMAFVARSRTGGA